MSKQSPQPKARKATSSKTKAKLLTEKEEKELSKIVQKGAEATKSWEDLAGEETDINKVVSSNPEATKPKLKKLKAQIEEGKAASDKFTEANMGLVVYMAKQYRGRNLSEPDLIQEGYLALVEAVQRFDAGKGARFSTYATSWIKPAIARAAKKQTRLVKLTDTQAEALVALNKAYEKLELEFRRAPTAKELSKEMEIPIKEVGEILKVRGTHLSLEYETSDGNGTIGDTIEYSDDLLSEDFVVEADTNKFFTEEIVSALGELDELSRSILEMRFGLKNGSEERQPPQELQKVAKELSLKTGKSISIAKVRHLESRALKILRTKVPDTEEVKELL